eukprot:TRINITY_DN10783_c0_g1_i1.p1 TRINITY_DN10783_c0_g1~~TRINITY_DN10783_c0_g1_i1.p1  ORF type:complete len:1353 (-),score=306.32 TRINITY_DN10783_c0_g1_i1:128-4186(-)
MEHRNATRTVTRQHEPLIGDFTSGGSSSSSAAAPPGGAWVRTARASALSGLRERVRTSFGVGGEKNLRGRQKLVQRATEAERSSLRSEDWRQIVREIWDTGESSWVLQRVRERPVLSDHVVAFKALQLLHRVLQHGPPEVAPDWEYPNTMIDGLIKHWSASARSSAPRSQVHHCLEALADYGRVIGAKMELMVQHDVGRMCFRGNFTCNPHPMEPSEVLQALAILLNFAEKLMPLSLHLVGPSSSSSERMWHMDRSQYMRLYMGAIAALLDESWLLLCSISRFVKELLCQVHVARQHHAGSPAVEGAERPPWLQLSLHLLQAQPRFEWLHICVCEFSAHCHQLSIFGFPELAKSIPTVPQSLLGLFADLDALVKGWQPTSTLEKPLKAPAAWQAFAQPGQSFSSMSTAVGSTRQPSPLSAPDSLSDHGSLRGLWEQKSPPQSSAVSNWEPSAQVLDALRTVDRLQPMATFPAAGRRSDTAEVPLGASGDGRVSSPDLRGGRSFRQPEGSAALPPSRNQSAPAQPRTRANSVDSAAREERQHQQRLQRSRRLGQADAAAGEKRLHGYALLDDDSRLNSPTPEARESRATSCDERGDISSAASPSPHTKKPLLTSSPDRESGGSSDSTAPASSSKSASPVPLWPPGPQRGAGQAPSPLHAALWPDPQSWTPQFINAATANATPAQPSNGAMGDGDAGPKRLAPAAENSGAASPPWPPPPPPNLQPAAAAGQEAPGTSWAAAICQSNTRKTDARPLFVTPLWQSPAAAAAQDAAAKATAQVAGSAAPPGAEDSPAAASADQRQQAGGSDTAQQLAQPGHATQPQKTLRKAMPLNPFDLSATQLQLVAGGERAAQAAQTSGRPKRLQGGALGAADTSGPLADARPRSGTVQVPVAGSRTTPRKGSGSKEVPSPVVSPVARAEKLRLADHGPPPPVQFGQARQQWPFAEQRQSHKQLPGRDSSPQAALAVGAGQHQPVNRGGAMRQASRSLERGRDVSPGVFLRRPGENGNGGGNLPEYGRQQEASGTRQRRHAMAQPRQQAAAAHGGAGLQNGGQGAGVVASKPPQRESGVGGMSAEWELEPQDVTLEEMIGSGSTADVYRGALHGTDVAVKRLRSSGPLSVEFTREISVLLRLRHPNLVLFMGACTQAIPPMIVSEYCAGGTVFSLLHQRRDLTLSWKQRLKMAVDVAKGMTFLHKRHVVHRDLKSLNFLLAAPVKTRDDAPQVKISDFGLSRARPATEQSKAQSCMTSGAGTYHWMAPEVLDGQTYDEKVDVYSYGICLYELITRRIPYDTSGLEPVSIAVAVSRGRRPDLSLLPRDCPADLRFTMECCWAHAPTGRPGFDTILETLKLVQTAA